MCYYSEGGVNMQNTSSTLNVRIDTLPFQPESLLSNAELLRAAIKRKNIPNIILPADEDGHAFIDKEKYPELYAWAIEEE